MKITLDLLEIVALQTVVKNPGERLWVSLNELFDYGLIERFEDGYKITAVGKMVLNKNTPYLCNGQNMKEPLGLGGFVKRKR